MSLFSVLETAINRSPFYNLLRYSALPDFLVEFFQKKTAKNIAFYNAVLPFKKEAIVFDIGANKGNKAFAFVKMGYQVVCLEPERGALQTLQYRFKKRRNIIIVPKGVSDQPGSTTLKVFDYRSGYNTLSTKWAENLEHDNQRTAAALKPHSEYEVPLTTLDALIQEYGQPYYVKIDVEGFEEQVVGGLSAPVPFLSFEANLPEFSKETAAIMQRLVNLDKNTRFILTRSEGILSEWVSFAEANELLSGQTGTIEVFAKT